MMELTDEEKAALIAALENDGNLFTSRTDKEPGPSLLWEYGGKGSWDLTPAGQIVATVLKKESRLERAREKLREWTKSSQAQSTATIEWEISSTHYSSGYADYRVAILLQGNEYCGAESDDPLTAVIEASKRTPWPLEE